MKKIAPAALVALKEALTAVYWFKRDLRNFIAHMVDNPHILSRLNWDDHKRNTVSLRVDLLAREGEKHQPVLLNLMTEVARIEDFSHLERLDDGAEKACQARRAIAALAKLIRPHEDLIAEGKRAEERRKATAAATLHTQGIREKLAELYNEFSKLLVSAEPQRRGYLLERILRELFALFDLDPKASFRIAGEQIDGAFTFDNTDYLLEAKWQQQLVGVQELDGFSGKVGRKLENTLGLFLSVLGFSADGVAAHCKERPKIILMDGADLTAVLEGRIPLPDLLLCKRRHAAQTGNIFLRIADIMRGT